MPENSISSTGLAIGSRVPVADPDSHATARRVQFYLRLMGVYFAVDALSKTVRRAYESELIRSRKPRFNIAP